MSLIKYTSLSEKKSFKMMIQDESTTTVFNEGLHEMSSESVITRFSAERKYANLYLVGGLSLCLMVTAFLGCGRSKTPLEGPPSLSASLSVNQNPITIEEVLTSTFESPLGAQALRLELMTRALRERSAQLGVKSTPDNLKEWRDRLPREDRSEANLYAWASQVTALLSQDEENLRRRYQREFPQGVRLVGRQVDLTPPQVWTPDHYQRQLGYFRAWARLKLTQIHHQIIEGASFSKLAREHSHHQESRERGGLITLKELSRSGISPQVRDRARSLRLGEISMITQDDQGAYLFYREDQERPSSLIVEGFFWPQSALSAEQLQSETFWSLLAEACPLKAKCALDQLIPQGGEGERLRTAWLRYGPEKLKRSLKREASRSRKRSRSRLPRGKREGDARDAPGGPLAWSKISPKKLTASGATYHRQLSSEVISQLKKSGYQEILSRATLFTPLPIMMNQQGIWLIRIRERAELPALMTPRLRMISLDLTRRGLQEKWGTWGIEQVGEHLTTAAREHRLAEALSVLNLKGTPIRATKLPPRLLTQALSVSLEAGAQLLNDSGTQGGQPTWSLVELERREPVSFEDVREELRSQVQRETQEIKALRAILLETWKALKVELLVANRDIDLSAAQSVGFTREIKL